MGEQSITGGNNVRQFGNHHFMLVVALLIGWTLVMLTLIALCVAASRGDAGDTLRRRDARLRRRTDRVIPRISA